MDIAGRPNCCTTWIVIGFAGADFRYYLPKVGIVLVWRGVLTREHSKDACTLAGTTALSMQALAKTFKGFLVISGQVSGEELAVCVCAFKGLQI